MSSGPDSILRVLNSRAEVRAFYDKISGVYDLLAERSEGPVRQAGLNHLAVGAGEVVLEVGCGTGHALATLARAAGPGGLAVGIDLSRRMLEQSRQTLAHEQAPAALLAGDGQRLPFGTGRFDALFMSFTLELFDTPDIPEVLAESRRILRPGGRLVVVGMSRPRGKDLMCGIFEWTHRHFPNLLDCRPIHVEESVAAAGFTIVAAETRQMWVPVEIVLARTPGERKPR
ncbi:MAG: class I SAM-dependent methyltransferase [Acidobacteriota bacterium]